MWSKRHRQAQTHKEVDPWQRCNCSLNPITRGATMHLKLRYIFLRTDITSPQNIQSKEEVVFALNRWTLLLVHRETARQRGTGVCPAVGGGNWAQGGRSVWSWDGECGRRVGRGKENGGWCLHCCPALTASLLMDHNSKGTGISGCATFLPCSCVEGRAVGWLGLATGLALETIREK